MSARAQARRNFIFVPGIRPDRFEKALDAGPDMVTIDLEDAILPSDKDRARELSLPLFAQHERPGICLLYTSPSPRDRQKSRMPSSA